MDPLSTTEGISSAVRQDPKLAYNPNLIKRYQDAGGTLSNYAIPSLTATFPSTSVSRSVTPSVVTSKAAIDNNVKIGNEITQSNQDLANHQQYKAQSKVPPPPPPPVKSEEKQPEPSAEDEMHLLLQSLGYNLGDEANLTPEQKQTIITDTEQIGLDNSQLDSSNPDSIASKVDSMLKGEYPLSTTEQAAVNNVREQASNALSTAQKIAKNMMLGATVVTARRGLQMYSPQEAMSRIDKAIENGRTKIADINSRIIENQNKLTQSFKDNNFKAATVLYDKISNDLKLRTTEINDINKAIRDELKSLQENERNQKNDFYNQVTKPIQELADKAKDNGAPVETINKILASRDLNSAYEIAGNYSAGGTGIIGEYNFYKNQAEAEGQVPVDFNTYQTMDANRKARAAATSISDGSGLNSKEATIFNSIVDKYNKSPLVAAKDRTRVLQSIINNVNNDPNNGAQQLSLAYGYIQALDTYQSAVREGELSLVNSIDSKVGQLKNSIEKIQNGQIVRPDVAKQIAKAAQDLVDTISDSAGYKQKTFAAQAKQNGKNVENAFNSFIETVNSEGGNTHDALIRSSAEAKSKIDDYIKNNPKEAERVAKLYETASPAFGGKIPNDIQIAEYLNLQ